MTITKPVIPQPSKLTAGSRLFLSTTNNDDNVYIYNAYDANANSRDASGAISNIQGLDDNDADQNQNEN